MKRIAAFLMAFVVIFTTSNLMFPTKADADNFSKNYTLTGDLAKDLVAVAKAQVGKSEKQLGMSGAWCARFVWHCAKYAKISKTIIPHLDACTNMYNTMVNKYGATKIKAADRQTGDLIFYYCSDNQCNRYIHVGIVEKTNNTYYAVEGNVGGEAIRYKGNYGYSHQVGWEDENGKIHYETHSVENGKVTRKYLRPNYPEVVKTAPNAPAEVNLSVNEFATGGSVTASWDNVTNSKSYDVSLICETNEEYNETKNVTAASATFVINNSGTYTVSVSAKNSVGSSEAAMSENIVVHDDVKVSFKDYDGTDLCAPVTIKWNSTVKAPSAPVREGYTFQGWDKGLSNITEDTVITATYSVNTYTVKFVDENGDVINMQRVEYGLEAKEPAEPDAPAGYAFVGWDKDDWKCVKKDLVITAVFAWENDALPVATEITSAVRNSSATGYDLTVALKNYPDGVTKGKIIATLKTEKGKMVASETQTFKINADEEKIEEIYIDYSGVATIAEVFVVGVIDDGNTGVPIGKTAEKSIDLGNSWSNWSEELPPAGDYEIESRIEYRYRNIETATSDSDILSGWTLDGREITDWSEWSEWTKTEIEADESREVETEVVEATYQTRYKYDRSVNNAGTYSSYDTDYHPNYQSIDLSYKLTALGKTNGHTYYGPYVGKYGTYLKNYWWNQKTYQKKLTDEYTQYRYRDAVYTYYFTRFSEWSDWSVAEVEESDARQIQERTVYRFKSSKNDVSVPEYNYKRFVYLNEETSEYITTYHDNVEYDGEWEYLKLYYELNVTGSAGIGIDIYSKDGQKWYRADVNILGEVTEYVTTGTLEDTSGKVFELTGKVNASGKNATLMVYKGTNTDPTASQLEYVKQLELGKGGEYEFEINPKEIPSIKTGDFIIVLGIEGSTAPIYVDTIYAPKPTYKVEFVDYDGYILSEQAVEEGGNAVVPEVNPEREGYDFTGWDANVKNITCDLTIQAQYKKKEYTVVFVDWENTDIAIKTFEHGDLLVGPEPSDKEGSTFVGWDAVLNGNVTVTESMIVGATYELNTYTISFTDTKGNIISTVTAKYGEEVVMPEETPENEGMIFTGWSDDDVLLFACEDVTVHPIFAYEEDTEIPGRSLVGGTYIGEQQVELTCATEDAIIYYAVVPEAEEYDYDTLEWVEYTEAVTISGNCILVYYAKAEGMNESNYEMDEYVILGKFSVEVTGSTLKNADGVVSGKIYYNITGDGNSAEGVLITAIYNENGEMVYRSMSEAILWNEGDNAGSVTNIAFEAKENESYTVKLFLWQSGEGMLPLSDVGVFYYN